VINRYRNFSIYRLERKPALALGSLLVGATGVLDFVTPVEISVTAFYLFGVLIVSWNCSRRWAFAFALIAFAVQFAFGLVQGAGHDRLLYFLIANANRLVTFFLVAYLATTLRALYDREAHTARIDDLTGAKNRKGFREVFEAEIVRHRRNGKPLCALYIDCDDFKVINDRFGHGEGDRVLMTVAAIATEAVRRSDTVGRLGGDEFAVLFPETRGADALLVAAKLRTALSDIASRNTWPISYSVGVGFFATMPPSADEAMKFADSVMYQAKSAGKDRTFWADYGDPTPARDAAQVRPLAVVQRVA